MTYEQRRDEAALARLEDTKNFSYLSAFTDGADWATSEANEFLRSLIVNGYPMWSEWPEIEKKILQRIEETK